MLLNELGFDEHFITPLRCEYLNPLAKLLFPDWVGGSLDSHKAFTVQYKVGEDLDLSYHYDNAEVTLNVCLGREFTESSLYFGNMRTVRTVGEGAGHHLPQIRIYRGYSRYHPVPTPPPCLTS